MAGSQAGADGLHISWDVPEAPGLDAQGQAPVESDNDRLRTAGPKDGSPATGANETLTVGGGRTEGAVTGSTKWKNIVLKRGLSSAAAPGGVRVAVGDVDGASDQASGQATGKRVHKPIRIRTYDAPLARGSLLIELAQPWPACAEGDRFNGAYLTVGTTHRYRLDNATIVGCAANAVAINYAKFAPAGVPLRARQRP